MRALTKCFLLDSMHFVKFDGLKPATKYTYKVKSPSGGWSDEYTFRSLRPYPETKIAMYLLRAVHISTRTRKTGLFKRMI